MTDSYKAWVEGIRIAVGALVSEARDSNKDISRLTREFMDQAQGINEFKRESSEESMTEEEKDFEKKKKLYELERREHELTQDIFGMEIKKVIGFNEDEARSLDEVTSAVGREKSKISELKSNMDDLEENIENIIGWNSDEVLSYDELTAAIDRTTEAIRKKNAAEEKKKYKKDKDRMSADTSEEELTAGWAGAFDSQRPSSDEGSSYSTTGMSYDDQATSSKIVGTYEQDAMTKDLLEKWGVTGAADGGIFQHPTLRMIGESGPEAVVPLNQVSGMGGVTFGNIQIVGSNMSASEVEIKFAQVIKRELASLGR